MLYSEIMAVCSQIHTKHINTLCGKNVEIVNVKPCDTYSDRGPGSSIGIATDYGLDGPGSNTGRDEIFRRPCGCNGITLPSSFTHFC